MKFFTKYSFLANIVSIVIVTGAVLYIGDKALESGGDPNNFSPASSVELTAFNFHYNSYDENGKLTINFIAKKLEEYVNQDTKMTDIFERSFDEKSGKENWNVKAHHGFLQKKGNNSLLHLYDDVNSVIFTKSDVNSKDSDSIIQNKGKYSPNRIYIKSSEMYYNIENHNFYNDKFVRIYDPKTGNNTTGTGVSGNSEIKIINLKKNVRSYYASS